MDIFEAINNSSFTSNYKSINYKNHMDILNHREYEYLYKELKYKNCFHFVDDNGTANFLAKIDSEKQVEFLMKNKKNINIIREIDGPILELSIIGMEKTYKYEFDLRDKMHLYNIKKLIENKEGYIHFIIYDNSKATKCFSAVLQMDDRIMKRFRYMINLCYEHSYPRIEFIEEVQEKSNYFSVEGDSKVLEKLLDTISNLQKWGSKDIFDVFVEYDKLYKIYFSGEVTNFKYIKTELSNNFKVIDEGVASCSGKPFVKYDMGMLFFFKSSENSSK